MSTFTNTKPTGPLAFFVGVLVAAFAVYGASFSGYQFLIQNRAATAAAHEIAEHHEEVLGKLVTEAKKKLAKGEKADEAALKKAAEERFATDEKVKASYEKKVEEIRHHAEGGLFPLACFLAVASAALGALFTSVLLVKRNKDSSLNAWLAFFSHFPAAATFALVAFLPILGHLAHHEGVGVLELIKAHGPVTVGYYLALAGAVILPVVGLLPSRKGGDEHHGDSCGCAH